MHIIPHGSKGKFRNERLFRPASVAVVGAGSADGAQVMANLMEGGFGGAVLPVDAALPAVAGVLAYRSVAALPVVPDLAVVATAPDAVAGALAALGERGCCAAVVVGMAPDLAAAAAASGVRVLGPGSFGVVVPGIGLNASRGHLRPRAGRLALVSQSAALCRAVLDWAEPNGVGFSHIIGIGGNADLGFASVLDWLARDPGTGAILLDIRRIRDRRAFLSAARAASRLRPLVAIRAGGRLGDPSGESDQVFEAALGRAGILSVNRLEDLLAAAETLTRARPARGEALAVVTNAIGPGQLAADAALRDGLALAALSAATMAVLRLHLPAQYLDGPAAQPGLVYVGPDAPLRLAETAALLAGAPEVGGVLAVHAPTGEPDLAGILALAASGKAMAVPLLVAAMGETTGAPHRRRMADAGVPAFAAPEQAVRAFAHLVQDRRNRASARELPASTVLEVAPDRAAVASAFAAVRAAGRTTLSQDAALAVLGAYGIGVVQARAAATAQEAAEAAAALGLPVVVKRRAVAREAAHDKGGLVLDPDSLAEVRAAAEALGPGADGWLVQRRVGRARELRVRVADDPTFGPAIAIGQGGSAGVALGELAFDLPPLNLTLARQLVARARVAATFAASHDQPAGDADAVADLLVRISQLVVDFPELAAIEVNPAFLDPGGARVADAWIGLRPAGAPAETLAIPPYPAELAETFEAGGNAITIRPIRPEDAEAHAAFFRRLTPEDVRFRFFSALRELSPEQVARMTQVDYEREIAFVGLRGADIVGVARLVRDPPTSSGEFAVVVQGDAKGMGLASRLMRRVIDWGASHGAAEITGLVLADNAPMLGFVRHLGFTIARIEGENDVVEARMVLGTKQEG